ncbi:hypothetical protein GUITHDRAFT_155710 [Guillardia theta CCMP2712]|uniref:LysM domain-containing protein n=2 Tax=Guillardia theta TaxID=55529 RepID=L1IE47_GUITC|nr:hypothetical protein GUITHDRAFT_155710 [Guillardia theta CCMP2712]EKX34546.1 hypothetical protein GUITHDRAFT_155710 [Guillardia theta CCMP2712]|eukprot:XP_005821526.1 hypothetical protein GUITHDRAFT_155710 [Guillardia theta CCMP2712]
MKAVKKYLPWGKKVKRKSQEGSDEPLLFDELGRLDPFLGISESASHRSFSSSTSFHAHDDLTSSPWTERPLETHSHPGPFHIYEGYGTQPLSSSKQASSPYLDEQASTADTEVEGPYEGSSKLLVKSHVVDKSDTISGICIKYNVTVDRLLAINKATRNTLLIRKTIKIPLVEGMDSI